MLRVEIMIIYYWWRWDTCKRIELGRWWWRENNLSS